MHFIEVTTNHNKKILINTDQIISVSTTTPESQREGKMSEILLVNNGICKVTNTYESIKESLLFHDYEVRE